jgi:HSP20 family protein
MLDLAYRPFFPLVQLQEDLGDIFDSAFAPLAEARTSSQTYPAVNLWEHGDSVTLEAELPGVEIKNVEILATGNQITLKVSRPAVEASENSGRTWHRRERAFGTFVRTMTMPWELATDKIEASLRDGVLTVNLPKAESSKPRKIKLITT